MSKVYHVEKSNIIDFDYIVYSTESENILMYIDAISDQINELSNYSTAKTEILFDTLLYSSNSPDRFIRATHDNLSFVSSSFEILMVPKQSSIRYHSQEFFSKNDYIIHRSFILNSVQKKIILKGIPI